MTCDGVKILTFGLTDEWTVFSFSFLIYLRERFSYLYY